MPRREQRVPQGFDDQRKRLLAATLGLSVLLRRPAAPRMQDSSRLGLGRVMAEHDLEQRHMSALLTVALYGPMTVTQLAERHHVSLKTASLVAVELEKAGMVQRREDPADRRRTIVAVAKDKRRMVEQGLANRAATLQRVLDRLTPVQREGFVNGLEVLVEEMSRQ